MEKGENAQLIYMSLVVWFKWFCFIFLLWDWICSWFVVVNEMHIALVRIHWTEKFYRLSPDHIPIYSLRLASCCCFNNIAFDITSCACLRLDCTPYSNIDSWPCNYVAGPMHNNPQCNWKFNRLILKPLFITILSIQLQRK